MANTTVASTTLSVGGVGYLIRRTAHGYTVYRRMRGRYWSAGVVGSVEAREVLRIAGLAEEAGPQAEGDEI